MGDFGFALSTEAKNDILQLRHIARARVLKLLTRFDAELSAEINAKAGNYTSQDFAVISN